MHICKVNGKHLSIRKRDALRCRKLIGFTLRRWGLQSIYAFLNPALEILRCAVIISLRRATRMMTHASIREGFGRAKGTLKSRRGSRSSSTRGRLISHEGTA